MRTVGNGLVTVGLAASVFLTACSGSGAPAEPARDPGTEALNIAIEAFDFNPMAATVPVGATVTWTNQDDILHTVTSGTGQEQGVPGVSENTDADPDGLFDRQLDGVGATFTFTFEETGAYPYYCSIHPGMKAEILVE